MAGTTAKELTLESLKEEIEALKKANVEIKKANTEMKKVNDLIKKDNEAIKAENKKMKEDIAEMEKVDAKQTFDLESVSVALQTEGYTSFRDWETGKIRNEFDLVFGVKIGDKVATTRQKFII